MEWALFEVKRGNYSKTRSLFKHGAGVEPAHPPLLTAWAQFEQSQGQHEESMRIQALADACDTKTVYRRI